MRTYHIRPGRWAFRGKHAAYGRYALAAIRRDVFTPALGIYSLARDVFHRAHSPQAHLVLPVTVEDSAERASKTTAMVAGAGSFAAGILEPGQRARG